MVNVLTQLAAVKVFVLDVDGVLTNGQLYLLEDGTQLKAMHIKDGYAMQLAIKKGFAIWIISGAVSIAAQKRLEKLGLRDIYFGVEDKSAQLLALVEKYQIDLKEILYMGDDMPDLKVMQLCGIKAAPADAVAEIKSIAQYISPLNGGEGCVRDVIEKTLKLQHAWE